MADPLEYNKPGGCTLIESLHGKSRVKHLSQIKRPVSGHWRAKAAWQEARLYHRILLPIDNSEYSNAALTVATAIASRFGSTLVGLHVYAARLHDDRFRLMENGLPEKYQEAGELQRQRIIHGSLITQGLEVISRSYLDYFERQCREVGVTCEHKMAEGTNYVEILRELERDSYDLLVIGVLGLGAVEKSLIGSVCERVLRKARTDVLVVKRNASADHNRIVVAIDGSSQSLKALERGLALSKELGSEVELVSDFDPHFHTVAFQSIASVLSEEAGKMFRFEEQENLHHEIIDNGLAKIYQGYLEKAQHVAQERGQKIVATLLTGKPFEQVLNHVMAAGTSLLIVGRFGAHRSEYADIGSIAENLVRLAPCNVLVVNGELTQNKESEATEAMIPWAKEAEVLLNRVPSGVMRETTRGRVEELARRQGREIVTPELVEQKYQEWARGSAQGKEEMIWAEAAKLRMLKIPEMVRVMVIKSVEDLARERGVSQVTTELIDEAKSLWETKGFSHH